MRKQTILKGVILGIMGMAVSTKAVAEVAPNFYIYLCIGQSNMEGQGQIYTADKEVDERFLMMSPICRYLQRCHDCRLDSLPYDFMAGSVMRLSTKCTRGNRVCYDISSKPLATIEWE